MTDLQVIGEVDVCLRRYKRICALHLFRFADVLRQMAKREPMLLVPQKLELTTQQAAAFLNVSRPFVIKEIQAQRLKCRLVNCHRRIEFEELQR